ncbi:MAG: histidine kinase N-terminal 7TM domain-containing protein [Candidatus Heimdallarchaeota archaeon]
MVTLHGGVTKRGKTLGYQISVFVLVLAVVTACAIFLLFYSLFFRPRSMYSGYFIALVISTAIWCGGYTLEFAATDLPTKFMWIFIEYIGITAVPPLFLFFVFVFAKRGNPVTKPLLWLLFLPPLIHYLVLVTNDIHNMFYLQSQLITTPDFVSIEHNYGIVFYSHTLYSYALLIAGLVFLIQAYMEQRRKAVNYLYQKQILIVFSGLLFPFAGNIIRVTNLIPPIAFIDLTPIMFVIAYILFAYAIFETGFLDIAPIARNYVFEEVLDGLLVLDQDWRIIDLNTAGYRILAPKHQPQEIYGKHIVSVLKEAAQERAYYATLFQIGIEQIEAGETIVSSTEILLRSPHKVTGLENRYYDLLATGLRRKDKLLGFLVILRDVTDRKRAETSLQKKQKLTGTILKLLSHDLKNHLMTMSGYSELARASLRNSSQDVSDIKTSLAAIEAKTITTMNLIEDVTKWLKIDSDIKSQEIISVDVSVLLFQVLKELEPEITEKRLNVVFEPPERDLALVPANFALKSAFLNLLHNSVKFSPSNGEIKIEVIKFPEIWRINFSDQGPGVPDTLKEEIFKPFTTFSDSKTKIGTGLGLTIVQEIIESFNGKVWVQDNQPVGSIFICEIPGIPNIKE